MSSLCHVGFRATQCQGTARTVTVTCRLCHSERVTRQPGRSRLDSDSGLTVISRDLRLGRGTWLKQSKIIESCTLYSFMSTPPTRGNKSTGISRQTLQTGSRLFSCLFLSSFEFDHSRFSLLEVDFFNLGFRSLLKLLYRHDSLCPFLFFSTAANSALTVW